MTEPRFKGVVFDVDGTLLTSTNRVSPLMRDVCHALVDKGVWLTIATARPPFSAGQIAHEIGAKGPLCALNGAIITMPAGSVVSRLSLADGVAQRIVSRFADDPEISLSLYSGTEWLVPKLDQRVSKEAALVGFMPTVRPDLSDVAKVEKILLMTDETEGVTVSRIVAKESKSVTVALSKLGYVEITPLGVDKKLGVATAARSAGLSLQNLVACGDGENDVSLLRECGFGIAMAHAPAALRAVAQQVVGSNDDDSLPRALAALF